MNIDNTPLEYDRLDHPCRLDESHNHDLYNMSCGFHGCSCGRKRHWIPEGSGVVLTCDHFFPPETVADCHCEPGKPPCGGGVDGWHAATGQTVSHPNRSKPVPTVEPVPGPYSIGSDIWPGLGKIAEEAGELLQVIGKLIANGGAAQHWDGTNLTNRLEDELGDLMAAVEFLMCVNPQVDMRKVHARATHKQNQFMTWHLESQPKDES